MAGIDGIKISQQKAGSDADKQTTRKVNCFEGKCCDMRDPIKTSKG